jgi:hypothetical protein
MLVSVDKDIMSCILIYSYLWVSDKLKIRISSLLAFFYSQVQVVYDVVLFF